MRNLLFTLALIIIPILGVLYVEHLVTQDCYAACHTDTECEACDQ